MNIQKNSLIANLVTSIVIQILILFISFIILVILYRNNRFALQKFTGTLFLWLLIAMILIVMSQDFYDEWSKLFTVVNLPTITMKNSFLYFFFLNIFMVTFLVVRTGGSKSSPFTSILFLLPTLAFFLKESNSRFLCYSFCVGVIYVCTLNKRSQYSRIAPEDFMTPANESLNKTFHDLATLWANISCLCIATLIGCITQLP